MGRRNKNEPKDPIEALGRVQRQGALLADEDAVLTMLSNESDRGVVLILGSFIEDDLAEAICKKFKPMSSTEPQTMVERGPLKDFNSRVLMGRALGIISEADARVLGVIKAMRNACAHSRRDITFGTPELLDALYMMLSPQDVAILQRSRSQWVARATFIYACSYVMGVFRGETAEQAHRRIRGAQEDLRREALREAERREAAQEKPTGKPAPSSR